jgi:tetratricopeptide (TPR) repeat protein
MRDGEKFRRKRDSFIKNNKYKKALKIQKKIVELKQNESSEWFEMGRLFLLLKKYGHALDSFKRSIRIEPNNASSILYLAGTYFQMNQVEDAVKLFTKVLDLDPSIKEAWFSLGLAYEVLEKHQLALESFFKALRLNLGDFERVKEVTSRISAVARKIDKSGLNELLSRMTRFIDDANYLDAALISVNCGTFVEEGGDPMILFPSIIAKVNILLQKALPFAELRRFNPDESFDALFEKDPESSEAWMAWDLLHLAMISIVSNSREALKLAQEKKELKKALHDIADVHEGARALEYIIYESNIK